MPMPSKDQVLGDFYYREAKRGGYRSRSALKLKEIAEKYRIFRKGQVVIDLGAAPGGWLQVEREMVGPEGLVIGVDLSPITPLPFDNVRLIRGDIAAPDIIEQVCKLAGGKADVVVSDLAPKFSGIHDLDHVRQLDLSTMALAVSSRVMRAGGSMIMKVLMGSEFKRFLSSVEPHFGSVRIHKPKASRESSSEVYLVCMGFRGKSSS